MTIYRNQTVRISDLTASTNVITGMRFHGCSLMGPAVVILREVAMDGCFIEGDIDALLWQINDDQPNVIGAVMILRCEIIECSFHRIGFVDKSQNLAQLRRSFGS